MTEVCLYTVRADAVPSPLLAEYAALLTAEEERRIRMLFRADDRRVALITRALVRSVLGAVVGAPPRSLCFGAHAYGKPFLLGANVPFNVSHTRELVVLAVGGGSDLGVDVEHNDSLIDPLALALTAFSPHEVERLRRLPSDARVRRFFETWTAKEAYAKARGMGFSLDSRTYTVHFGPAPRVECEGGPAVTLQLGRLDERTPAAVAQLGAVSATITVRSMIPLARDHTLAEAVAFEQVAVADP